MSPKDPDLKVKVGDLEFPNPIMSASGSSGFGAELSVYMDLSRIGAIVTKSLSHFAWEGNPYPRISEAPGGMLNSVGLQGPGIEHWIENYLPSLKAVGARIIVSLWGSNTEDFQKAAQLLEPVKADLKAMELNFSCPNTSSEKKEYKLFLESPEAMAETVRATDIGIARWVKLGPDTPGLCETAAALRDAGADAITLVNSLPAMRIDAKKQKPYLANTMGGFSGPALKPAALKAVYECFRAVPGFPIVGAGGVRSGEDVAEFLMAGASAVQIGAATFLNPRALVRILKDFRKWCRKNKISSARDLTGIAHRENS